MKRASERASKRPAEREKPREPENGLASRALRTTSYRATPLEAGVVSARRRLDGVARHGARRWRGNSRAHHSTREGESGTEVVGNHPAARVIASLRRSAAIVVSCRYPLVVVLPTVSSPGFSYRVRPRPLLLAFLYLSLGCSPFVSRARSLRFSRQRHLARSVSFSCYRFRPSALFRSDDGSSSESRTRRRGCLSYTGIREYGYPPAAPSPPSTYPAPSDIQRRRVSPPVPSPFLVPPSFLRPRVSRRLRHRRGRV